MTVKCPYCGHEGTYKVCRKCKAVIPEATIDEAIKNEREKKRESKEGGKK